MNLMNRYIAEVGRHLPEKDRADIEAEIRTMIEDMLEERGHHRISAGDAVIAETLEELGDPRRLAYKYAPPRHYLIGPGWYEGYIKVLQRVLYTAVPIFAVVTFLLTLSREPLDFVNALGEAAGGAFNVGVQILFWVTLVFVLLERSDEEPGALHQPSSGGWSVAQLPAMPGKRQISIGEALTDIFMELFVLVWIALPLVQGWLQGGTGAVPLLHPDLWDVWLPILIVLIILHLIHDVFKLKIGRWTPALTLTNVILCLGSILYIAALVTTQAVINPAFWATLNSAQQAQVRDVNTWSTWTVNITAAILIGILVWDMVNSIRLARRLKETPGLAPAVRNVS